MPLERHRIPLVPGGAAVVLVTGRDDGDLGIDGPSDALAARRAAVVERPWVWLRQVHGARVVDGDAPEAVGAEADAVVAVRSDVALAVQTADCVPVALVATATGAIAAAHAGWRGLVAGLLQATVAELQARGPSPIRAIVGPCICARCYEFGSGDLDAVAARLGDVVRSRTSSGAPALDLRAATLAALGAAGVTDVVVSDRCTATEATELFSHRARAERGRQALVVYREDG